MLLAYLKRQYKLLLLLAGAVCIFAAVFALYDLPLMLRVSTVRKSTVYAPVLLSFSEFRRQVKNRLTSRSTICLSG